MSRTSGLMDVDDAAAYLKLSPHSIRKLYQERKLPCVRFGRSVRFRQADLDGFVEAHAQAGEGPVVVSLS